MARIGLVGLGLRNPYTYAELFKAMDSQIEFVWDHSPEKANDFAQEFGATVVEDLSEFPFEEIDGALIEGKNHEHCPQAQLFIDRDIPVFIEKPLSNDPSEALEFLSKNEGKAFLTCSPLRFSENYLSLQADVQATNNKTISLCSVTVLHTMEHFLADPGKRWHDRPTEGGGMVVDIGIHAVELLNMFVDKKEVEVRSVSAKTYYDDAESGDLNKITVIYDDQTVGDITLLCATSELEYSVQLDGPDCHLTNNRLHPYGFTTNDPENAYGGFRGTMEAFLRTVESRSSPIDLRETRRNFELMKMILKAQKQ